MDLALHSCETCGGPLKQISDSIWKCSHCGNEYEDTAVKEATKTMQEIFNEAQQAQLNNLRRNLYDAVTAKYISSTDVKNSCIELKKYLPDDFCANFYEVAVSENLPKLLKMIRDMTDDDIEKNYVHMSNIVKFLIKSLDSESILLDLKNLIERIYKNRDSRLFGEFNDMLDERVKLLVDGVYETKLQRAAFIAYSSKDMEYVSELVEVLEQKHNISCFVAARNLSHGSGAVENYEEALHEAMDNCDVFVFVSTPNSRSNGCDAYKKEIPYIKQKDIDANPQYRGDYAAIPIELKKPRVEYRIIKGKGKSRREDVFTASDQIVKAFFEPIEWVLTPDAVALRIESLRQDLEAKRAHMQSEIQQEHDTTEKTAPHSTQGTYSSTSAYTHQTPAKKKKSKAAAIFLALFLGGWGIDQFYLGYTKRGTWRIIWTFLSCGIISGIWSLIDCFRIAGGSLPLDPAEMPKKKKRSGWKVFFTLILIAIIFFVLLAIADSVLELGIFTSDSPSSPNEDVWVGNENETWDVADGTEVPLPSDENVSGEYSGIYYEFSNEGILTLSASYNNYLDWSVVSNLYFPDGMQMKSYVKKVVVSSGITEIGDSAFANMDALEEVEISADCVRIGNNAFDYCRRLSSVKLGGVKYISSYAFNTCTSLTEIALENVTEIGSSAFSNCNNLTSFTGGMYLENVSADSFAGSGAFDGHFDKDETLIIGNTLIKVSSQMSETYRIDAAVTRIAPYAFAECQGLKQVIIHENVNYIGSYAFQNANDVDLIVFLGSEESVSSIRFGDNVYYNTGSNTQDGKFNFVYTNGEDFVDNSDEYTEGLIFQINSSTSTYFVTGYTGSDTDIIIPSEYLGVDVTGIGENAFYYKTGITSVEIPATVKLIRNNAFEYCESLYSVKLLGYETETAPIEIESRAFCGCPSLDSFEIAETRSVEFIGSYAFSNSGLSSNTEVGAPLVVGNVLLYVHNDESGIFEIPSNVTQIPRGVFENCGYITAVIIPKSVTKISSEAFKALGSLKELIYAGTEDEWASVVKAEGWDIIDNGEEISVSDILRFLNGADISDPSKTYSDGLSFAIDRESRSYFVSGYSGTDVNVVIPSEYLGAPVTGILRSVFYDNNSIVSVTVPASLRVIEDHAFFSCDNLVSFKVADPTADISSLEVIGDNAFNDCYSLASFELGTEPKLNFVSGTAFGNTGMKNSMQTGDPLIIGNALISASKSEGGFFEIPASVNYIANSAFVGCSGINMVVIPTEVTRIGENAFCDMSILEEIVYLGTSEQWDAIQKDTNWNVSNGYDTENGSTSIKILEGTFDPSTAETYTRGLKFVLDAETGTYTVSGYSGSDKNVIIPSSILGINVTAIAHSAFSGNSLSTGITEVTIPATVTKIGEYAFAECTSLVKVNFADGIAVTEIPYQAFYNCAALEAVIIPASVTAVGDQAFASCDVLASIEFGEGSQLSAIGANAFERTAITSFVIPDGVTSIGSLAFYDCSSLVSVTSGQDAVLTHIGNEALAYCEALAEVVLPKTLETVGQNLFESSSNVRSATLPATAVSYLNCGSLEILNVNGGGVFDSYVLRDNKVIKEIKFSEGVTEIGDEAFYYCSNLTKVELCSGIQKIGSYSFVGCTALEEITLPDTLTSIASYAFQGCSSLKSISIPEGMVMLEGCTFEGCTSLATVTLPSTLESIANGVFRNCSALKSIQLPTALSEIGDHAFYSSGLEAIVIPENVVQIGIGTFSYCPSLSEVTIPNGITSVGMNAFEECTGIVKLTMPVKIATYVLNSAVKLTVEEIVLTGGKTIQENAFSDCTRLSKITLHEGLTTISNYAFNNCYSLLSITIPSSLTGCGSSAFEGCNKLVEVIDLSGRNVAQYVSACLSSDGTQKVFYTEDNYAFFVSDEEVYLLGYLGDDTELILPQDYDGRVYSIFNNAFQYDQTITSVSIPKINGIGDNAFIQCTALVSVDIADSESPYYIGAHAFNNCDMLSNLVIGDGVDVIKTQAFAGCSSLEEVVLPESLNKLEQEVFVYCSSIASIVFEYSGQYGISSVDTTDASSYTLMDVDNSYYNVQYLRDTHSYCFWYKQ